MLNETLLVAKFNYILALNAHTLKKQLENILSSRRSNLFRKKKVSCVWDEYDAECQIMNGCEKKVKGRNWQVAKRGNEWKNEKCWKIFPAREQSKGNMNNSLNFQTTIYQQRRPRVSVELYAEICVFARVGVKSSDEMGSACVGERWKWASDNIHTISGWEEVDTERKSKKGKRINQIFVTDTERSTIFSHTPFAASIHSLFLLLVCIVFTCTPTPSISCSARTQKKSSSRLSQTLTLSTRLIMLLLLLCEMEYVSVKWKCDDGEKRDGGKWNFYDTVMFVIWKFSTISQW